MPLTEHDIKSIPTSRARYQLLDLAYGEKELFVQFNPSENVANVLTDVFSDTQLSTQITTDVHPYDSAFIAGETRDHITALINAIQENDNQEIGTLLSYPDCCVETYVTLGDQNTHHKSAHRLLTEFDTFPYQNNTLLDVWHQAHFLCGYDCDASVEIGERRLNLAAQHFPEETAHHRDLLSSCVIYRETDDTAYYATDYTVNLDTNTIRHDGFTSRFADASHTPGPDETFLNTVNATGELTVHDHTTVTVNNDDIDDDEYTIVCFT